MLIAIRGFDPRDSLAETPQRDNRELKPHHRGAPKEEWPRASRKRTYWRSGKHGFSAPMNPRDPEAYSQCGGREHRPENIDEQRDRDRKSLERKGEN